MEFDKPRILLVDDEAAFAAMLLYNLEAHGFLVEHVTNGQEALSRCEVPAASRVAGLDIAGKWAGSKSAVDYAVCRRAKIWG